MRKVIAAINMTLDGVSDHTVGIVDEKLHEHYSDLIYDSGVILYGRKTFELMTYWKSVLQNPAVDQSMNEFAKTIDKIPKIVFSKTLQDTNWESAKISDKSPKDEVLKLKSEPGKSILIGSRSLIIELLNHKLVDEFQIAIHPIIAGNGLSLFEYINERIDLKLIETKTLSSGVIILNYRPIK